MALYDPITPAVKHTLIVGMDEFANRSPGNDQAQCIGSDRKRM